MPGKFWVSTTAQSASAANLKLTKAYLEHQTEVKCQDPDQKTRHLVLTAHIVTSHIFVDLEHPLLRFSRCLVLLTFLRNTLPNMFRAQCFLSRNKGGI